MRRPGAQPNLGPITNTYVHRRYSRKSKRPIYLGPIVGVHNRGAKDVVHPTAGGYLGGHKERGSFHMELVLDSDDDWCYI